jgi:4'-phosphopantetheinyl transferase
MAAIELLWPAAWPVTPIGAGEIHVWAVGIDDVSAPRRHLWSLLAEDERQRAERFRFDEPRDRFVAARAALRRLLAAYLDCQPHELAFLYDAFGKPSLMAGAHQSRLRFNVAHSAALAVIAITTDCEVGADVECLRPVRQAEGISERYFHPAESAEVLSGASTELLERFFRCWTHKEAVIKAIGTGLQYPLERFRVPVLQASPCWIDLPQTDRTSAARFWLQPFVPCPGYLGAVATLGEKRTCKLQSLRL